MAYTLPSAARGLFLVVLFATSTASTVPAYAAGDVKAGEQVFKRCASCHQVGPYAANGFGPHLNELFGRRAGSLPDYWYSSAMKNVRDRLV
jgi:cytochrome c